MNLIHGFSRDPLYVRWINIKHRCYNPKRPGYKNYGGRGIKVCDEWRNDFKVFYNYMINTPHYNETNMTIDRIDNEGNYEPGNVRWATYHEQSKNRRIRSSNTSGYMGVSYYKSYNKWIARITVYGKRSSLGYYKDIKDAVNARNQYIIDNNLTEYKIQNP